MSSKSQTELLRENAELRARLEEAEETLRAIRHGEVDALVVAGDDGDRAYTLQGADRSYRILMETMSEGAATLSPDGTILYCNGQFAKLLQSSQQSVIGSSITRFLRASQRSEFNDLLDRRTEGGVRKEMIFSRADGSTLTVLVALNALELEGAEGISFVATDLTERKAAEEQLRRARDQLEQRVAERTEDLTRANDALAEKEQRYRLLFDRNPDGVFVLDTTGRFLIANPACETMSGYPSAELMQKTFMDLCAPDQLATAMEHFQKALRDLVYTELETALIHKDGRRIEVWVAGEVTVSSDKKVALHCTAKNITERKQAEEALARAKAELERYSQELELRVKERTTKLQEAIGELLHFSYTITHDMRAPLRAMQGYGDLLREEEASLSEKGQMCITRIGEAAHRMDQLIVDALDYAKLSQHAFELHPVDVGALLKGMIATYPHYQLPAARISLAEKLPPVLANEAGLTQCFSNLLDNAIKFVTPGQTPEIRIWAEEKAGDSGQESGIRQTVVRFWVEDNGIGIRPEHQEKVFGMFQRLSPAYEGTGIGLALVQKAAQRMNGLVGVESELGKGSRFWLEFGKVV